MLQELRWAFWKNQRIEWKLMIFLLDGMAGMSRNLDIVK
jgi:hypothetical protein